MKSLAEIGRIFLRLGFLGFGGPIAVIAMMEEEAVRKRSWLSHERFAELYAVFKLMPGPISTQLAVYLGLLRSHIAGGLTAGFLFVLPAFALVLGLSILYFEHGLAEIAPQGLFSGFQAGALVVIFLSAFQLGKSFRNDYRAWGIGLVSAVLTWALPRWEPLVILGFGALGVWSVRGIAGIARPAESAPRGAGWGFIAGLLCALAVGAGFLFFTPEARTLAQLFWMSFKSGAFVFGSGLAIVPLLEADAVHHYHWLSVSEFMDGLAFGQVTPGPVVITVTFIGYKAAGLLGACVATVGMFLPPFLNALFIVPKLWSRFSGTPAATAFTTWAVPSVIGGIVASGVRLSSMTLGPSVPTVVAITAALVALLFKAPSWFLVLFSGALGAALGAFL